MPSIKRINFKKIFTTHKACGCGTTKATDVIEPKPKSRTSFSDQNLSRCPSFSGGQPSTTSSLNMDNSPPFCPENLDGTYACSKPVRPACPRFHAGAIAVVKDSVDPYRDFRQSMLHMIFEEEIYSRNELEQLLQCFLELNHPHHHEVIVRAFVGIWNGGVAVSGGSDDGNAAVFLN